MLIYGNPKIGKTSLASQIENVLICEFEPGASALHNVLVQPIAKWEDWKKCVRQLVKDREKLKEKISVVCLDTVDEAYKACKRWICQQNGIDNLKEIPYGGAYELLDEEFSSTLRDIAFAGYGMVFISHSAEKTFKDDKGQEYAQIVPALPNRPYNIVNKMVDIITYLRLVDIQEGDTTVQKRYLFFRGDNRFYAGSRFQYIVPYVEFSYNNLVKAFYDAIDQEIKVSGGAAAETNENPFTKLDYDSLMAEARTLWIKLAERELTSQATQILADIFGKPIKFSEIKPEEVEKLFTAISEIKAIL